MAFARFMSRPMGRIIRVVLGLAIIASGIWIGGTTGIVVGLIGLAPIAAGAFNFCLAGPIVGGYFEGRKNLEAPPSGPRRTTPQH
ncbi:DUF2892 domain-containing protein [Rubrobacter marinus]|uniref:DUF2892 domain-containing protein n=1 Tax=Rubrobacter marinus TaxID=2653852 RepID=A0A6G8PW68_9ACTN|nr:DUF2892 domain-containing protein [Rubrobacter marinus]QIN78415.1 DUF2892 domain-containing protein [Rubrobacter marinus]